MNNGQNVTREKAIPRRRYAGPVLTKGPVLSAVTARPPVSEQTTVSDIRLKRDIRPVERLDNGLTLYRFRYLWSDEEMVGVMAQDVLERSPGSVVLGEDGYYRVDYGSLGLRCVSYARWQAGNSDAVAA